MQALFITDDPGKVFRAQQVLRPLGIETSGINYAGEWVKCPREPSKLILGFDPLFGCIASMRPDIIFVAGGKSEVMNSYQIISAIRGNAATRDSVLIQIWSGLSLLGSAGPARIETIVEPMTLVSARTALSNVLPEREWVIDST
ncbi:hypothetical protein QAO71_17860 (plasmid) [Halopseudomonas sp. SMJS2]|uniref:hypothetical protein n=1 Tax=Halopseudomonas sp. SMJS2 TaxID=3041098 RepID=UPI0024532F04|nr:hypothetical protein [Halopseudomonas sp. SMJS2]WGK63408.1 hypothetical protein QAO71_17860 [Halopseudomonas sp. SMJS2]